MSWFHKVLGAFCVTAVLAGCGGSSTDQGTDAADAAGGVVQGVVNAASGNLDAGPTGGTYQQRRNTQRGKGLAALARECQCQQRRHAGEHRRGHTDPRPPGGQRLQLTGSQIPRSPLWSPAPVNIHLCTMRVA